MGLFLELLRIPKPTGFKSHLYNELYLPAAYVQALSPTALV